MKVLVGTPIHQIKDYSMKRWLESVSKIKSDADWKLFMVDNSQNPDWHKRVHEYCNELNFTNYELLHLPGMRDGETWEADRLGLSRESIREKLLKDNYDYWWSLECDIICPPETLTYLLKFTPEFEAVYHTYPPRFYNPMSGLEVDYQEQDGIGCVLYDRRIFYTFKFVENQTPLGADGRLLFEVVRRGWKVVEVHNIFRLEHLGK